MFLEDYAKELFQCAFITSKVTLTDVVKGKVLYIKFILTALLLHLSGWICNEAIWEFSSSLY